MIIEKAIKGTLVALTMAAITVAASAIATTASAASVVGVQVGPGGVGLTVNNGYYYDRRHHRQRYSYPSDWQSYHHPRSWYYGHRHWNEEKHRDYYRR